MKEQRSIEGTCGDIDPRDGKEICVQLNRQPNQTAMGDANLRWAMQRCLEGGVHFFFASRFLAASLAAWTSSAHCSSPSCFTIP